MTLLMLKISRAQVNKMQQNVSLNFKAGNLGEKESNKTKSSESVHIEFETLTKEERVSVLNYNNQMFINSNNE
ncbi:hypothetical protein DN752_01400 [Echinicola strongylocentroti]|uniref:Uncharacterized protein n=1 Tax=Echinicola strongylocentroti TaxID=1795355 RepID=A0A2Z4ID22_9BACT|nr:hypothetical protein [Echinicola strongylocentroti]AWW28892.1 hypothetical protein DN752_01400 [Echinicola strongylocentroti]